MGYYPPTMCYSHNSKYSPTLYVCWLYPASMWGDALHWDVGNRQVGQVGSSPLLLSPPQIWLTAPDWYTSTPLRTSTMSNYIDIWNPWNRDAGNTVEAKLETFTARSHSLKSHPQEQTLNTAKEQGSLLLVTIWTFCFHQAATPSHYSKLGKASKWKNVFKRALPV